MKQGSLPQRRPAETATGLTGAVVAILVATTGLSTELATALVVVVGALPGVVTTTMNLRRSTAAGQMLVGLTPQVAALAESALSGATEPSVALSDKTTTLKAVTESMSAWTDVLTAEPGADSSGEG